jgi:sugar phosphate isomerase/epimerase
MQHLTRRQFTRALAGLASLPALAAARGREAPRVAVSTWSFHNYFPNTRYGEPRFKLEEWRLEDVIRRARERLGITAFEVSSAHLRSQEPKYLDELSGFVKEQRCRLVHLSDNVPGINLARADAKQREADLRTFERLIEVARRLSIPTMRVNTGTPDPKQKWDMNVTFDAYRRLARFGAERRVEIIIENHFGISADPRNVVRIIEAVKENVSACPDFGLFRRDEDRWPGLELLFRHSRRVCSAKFHGLTEKNEHRDFDLRRCYRILTAARFPGWVSLEYEGNQEPMPQLQRMHALARQWLAEK